MSSDRFSPSSVFSKASVGADVVDFIDDLEAQLIDGCINSDTEDQQNSLLVLPDVCPTTICTHKKPPPIVCCKPKAKPKQLTIITPPIKTMDNNDGGRTGEHIHPSSIGLHPKQLNFQENKDGDSGEDNT
jgi:hypothetical protein